jgi:hypothetical protein
MGGIAGGAPAGADSELPQAAATQLTSNTSA